VDIGLPGGRSDRVVICEGDDTEILAKNFCNKHTLPLNTVIDLKSMLNKELKKL